MNQPHIYIHPLLFGFPSHLGHHRALSRVHCAILWGLISYLFYTYQCIYISIAMFQFIFQDGASGKGSACQCRSWRRHRFYSWVEKILWRSKYQPTPVFLPGKSHGPRSLVGYSPWGRKESDAEQQQGADMCLLFLPFGFNELKSTFLKFPSNFALALLSEAT